MTYSLSILAVSNPEVTPIEVDPVQCYDVNYDSYFAASGPEGVNRRGYRSIIIMASPPMLLQTYLSNKESKTIHGLYALL